MRERKCTVNVQCSVQYTTLFNVGNVLLCVIYRLNVNIFMHVIRISRYTQRSFISALSRTRGESWNGLPGPAFAHGTTGAKRTFAPPPPQVHKNLQKKSEALQYCDSNEFIQLTVGTSRVLMSKATSCVHATSARALPFACRRLAILCPTLQ
jgi:hypothetical protein